MRGTATTRPPWIAASPGGGRLNSVRDHAGLVGSRERTPRTEASHDLDRLKVLSPTLLGFVGVGGEEGDPGQCGQDLALDPVLDPEGPRITGLAVERTSCAVADKANGNALRALPPRPGGDSRPSGLGR